MRTISYADILTVLRSGKPGWMQTFPRQLDRLRNVLTDELVGCAGLGLGCAVPQDLTLQEFRARLWEIRLDRERPLHLRDEVQEFDAACAIHSGSDPRPPRPPEFGRPCAYCWRNEEGRFASHASPYGMCHLHKVPPDPQLDDDDHPPAAETGRRERNRARRAVTKSKALLRLDRPELFIGHKGHPLRRYPIYNEASSRPITGEGWDSWLEHEYPILLTALKELDRPEVLAHPIATIECLESRLLTGSERALYSGETNGIAGVSAVSVEEISDVDLQTVFKVQRVVMQRIWEVPIAKCAAWLNLERLDSADKGRQPDYGELLHPVAI